MIKKIANQIGITTLIYVVLSICFMFALRAGFMCSHALCFANEPIGLGLYIVASGILGIPYGIALVIILFIITPINIFKARNK